MRYWKAIVLCAVTILVWAWVDSVIWRIMFEPHQAALRAAYGQAWLDVYHWGWADMLKGMIALGMIGLWPDKARMAWYAISTWLMANSGLEDVLYYALAGMPVPDRLAWLDGKYWAVMPVTTPHPHELYKKEPAKVEHFNPAEALLRTEKLIAQAESAVKALEAKSKQGAKGKALATKGPDSGGQASKKEKPSAKVGAHGAGERTR